MLNQIFRGVFDTDMTAVITPGYFLLCIAAALAAGLILALAHTRRDHCTKSFVTTLALLPAVVCVVIMMVNGNVGAGVAVAGAFSLVRFRSAPGTAREITMLFFAMGAGLMAGMGYLAFCILFVIVACGMFLLYDRLDLGVQKKASRDKTLRITVPEDLDYSGAFDDILRQYARQYELVRVKTTNMGSLFRLTYELTLLPDAKEKEMLDALRCRNGNLEISLSRQETEAAEL